MLAKTLISGLFAISATALAAASAQAASPDPDVMSVKVSVADLDLGGKAGAAAGLHRIEAASDKACGGQPSNRLLRQQARYHACMQSTISRAVASLDSPIVTALYTGKDQPITRVASR